MHPPAPAVTSPQGLGELLTRRSKGPGQRLVLSLVMLATGFAGCMFLFTAARTLLAPDEPDGTAGAVVGLVLGAVLLWFAWLALRGVFSVYRFHERGATRSLLGRIVQAVEYERLAAMSYSATRRYVNGVYAGTDVVLELEPLSVTGLREKPLVFRGPHREKPDGVLSRTFLAKNFKGEDELDAIKNHIAQVIARRWRGSGQFAEPWGGGAVLGADRITLQFRSRPELSLAYADIEGMDDDGEHLRVRAPVGEPPFFLVPRGGRNFWPGLALVEQLRNGT